MNSLRSIYRTVTLALVCSIGSAGALALSIGPDPTSASIAADGPFSVSTQSVSGGSGFAGGTVYVPNTAGSYALVAFCPGFLNDQSAVAVLGRRLATHC